MEQTGRDLQRIDLIRQYLKKQGLMRDFVNDADLTYSSVLELNLSDVHPCISGPKRPHDYIALNDLKSDWSACLTNPVGFKGFGLKPERVEESAKFQFKGEEYELKHGSLVIASITSCTNTSNPSVMLAAALLCRNAFEKGLKVAPYIKTSLSPGSQAVSKYY